MNGDIILFAQMAVKLLKKQRVGRIRYFYRKWRNVYGVWNKSGGGRQGC